MCKLRIFIQEDKHPPFKRALKAEACLDNVADRVDLFTQLGSLRALLRTRLC